MKSYPAKLLIFGEHTVNAGSQALAVPLPLFSGKWAFADLPPAAMASRQRQLPQFADYLEQLQQKGELLAHLDVAAFRQALNEGLYFDSNIPTGYGVGSSGALVAAVFGDFGFRISDFGGASLLELKKALAQMEAFFHGTSSGTDPLICFLQKPVLLGGAGFVQIVDLVSNHQSPVTSHQFFLLDTGMERQATPLIQYFLEKMQGEDFSNLCRAELLPSVDGAIAAFLSGDGCRVFEEMHHIGRFQLHFLEKLVPEKFRSIWQQGLDGDLFKLKVCGAGGGGFLLGIAKDFEATKAKLAGWKLLPVLTI